MKTNNKQKILAVTAFPTYGAGSGVQVTDLTKSYLKEGHDVRIITGNNNTKFPKIDGVKYHIVPFTSEEEQPEKIPGQCNFNYLMFTTHTESTANFWDANLEQIKEYVGAFRKAINEEVKDFKPDVIHAHHNWISSAIATETGVPTVLTIHGTDLMGFERSRKELERIRKQLKSTTDQEATKRLKDEEAKYSLYIEYANRSALGASKIIVISEAQKELFTKLFPLAVAKVELVENGYDTQKFYVDKTATRENVIGELQSDSTEDGKIPLDYDKLVTFVGKFADFKGIDVLLDAAKLYEEKMQKQGQKVATVIVGSGQLEGELKEQAKKLGLQNTHFVGRKNSDEVRRIQSISDVSVVPSRNEPFGLVVLEGMACGHPVIGTNAGGIPGILNVNKNDISDTSKSYVTPLGILVPMEDSQALSDAVCGVLTGKEKFDNQYIVDYTKEHYAQEKVTKHILEIFEEAINHSKSTHKERE